MAEINEGEMSLSLNVDFENIKKIDENGFEYWEARELLPILGYKTWEKAKEVIARAARACIMSGQDVDNHFPQTVKMVKLGSNTTRKIDDYKLNRYSCYLVAQNGDPNKPEIALAQTYFDLSSKDRKKIMTGAVKEANIEQHNLVKEYGHKCAECHSYE